MFQDVLLSPSEVLVNVDRGGRDFVDEGEAVSAAFRVRRCDENTVLLTFK